MNRVRLTLQAVALAALLLAPAVWLAHVMAPGQPKRAADPAAWCAHDWQELAMAQCHKLD